MGCVIVKGSVLDFQGLPSPISRVFLTLQGSFGAFGHLTFTSAQEGALGPGSRGGERLTGFSNSHPWRKRSHVGGGARCCAR
jgi:hypothetical protein